MREYTLLMWELVPEETEMFLIPQDVLSPADWEALRLANGHFINGDAAEDCDGVEYVSEKIQRAYKHNDNVIDPEGKWRQYLVEHALKGAPIELKADEQIAHIVLCGFLL